MKIACVINGCSPSALAQARQLAHFIETNFPGAAAERQVIFCRDFSLGRELARLAPSRRALLVKTEAYQPERALAALAKLCAETEFALFPGNFFGDELAVRLAARLGGDSQTAVLSLEIGGDGLCSVRKKVYAQNLTARLALRNGPACLSLARGSAESDKAASGSLPQTEEVEIQDGGEGGHIICSEEISVEEDGSLAGAERLVVVGNGLGGAENLPLVERLAEAMDAALGASRPAVMNAWLPLNRLVGVSGAMCAPKLCLAVGVSGASALWAGVEKAGFIAAINRDPKAAVMGLADAAVESDFEPALRELTELFENSNKRRSA